MITIRHATPVDAPMVAELTRQTFYDTFHAQNTPENMALFLEQHCADTTVLAEMNDPDNTFLLAFDTNKKPVGYAKVSDKNKKAADLGIPSMELCRLYCTKEAIGTGVGSKLMQQCLDIARAANKKMVWLGVWEHNQRAIEFYRRFKFEKVGQHVFMLGNDSQTDWLMACML